MTVIPACASYDGQGVLTLASESLPDRIAA
jgi:hypothetical protein